MNTVSFSNTVTTPKPYTHRTLSTLNSIFPVLYLLLQVLYLPMYLLKVLYFPSTVSTPNGNVSSQITVFSLSSSVSSLSTVSSPSISLLSFSNLLI